MVYKSSIIQPAGGDGTVTQIDTGLGLTGGPITTTGTIAVDPAQAITWIGKQTFNTVAVQMGTLTASRALVSDGSKDLISSVTTLTELSYVNGVTSAIQTQLDSKQGTGNYITALTGNVTASGPGSAAATIANGVVTGAMMSGTGAVRTFGVTVTGGEDVVPTGAVTASITVPITGTIIRWYVSSDISGSIVFDILRSAVSIVGGGGNKPTLSGAASNNAAPTSWTSTAVTAGDIFYFNVDSSGTLTSATLVIAFNVT